MIRRIACRICWGDAIQKGVYGNLEEVSCEGCGRYLISRSLLKGRVGKAFDVERMRIWMDIARKAGQVPYVNDQLAVWHFQQPKTGAYRLPGWPSDGSLKWIIRSLEP
jgi:hypothetical protein